MVTHYEALGKKHATINIYTGIFNNKTFREGGKRNAKTEGLREDVSSESSRLQVESASCVSHVISEKSTSQRDAGWMNAAKKNPLKADAELEPLSHFDVADIEKKDLQPHVIGVLSDINCTNKNPHVQNNVGSNAETYTNPQYNVGHVDHDNTKWFHDEPLNTVETNYVQQCGPYQSQQRMPCTSQKALRRNVDVNDNAGLIDGVSDDGYVPVMKNRELLHTRTDGLLQSEKTSSACIQAVGTPILRKSFASVNEICSWEKILESTVRKNGHVLHLHEKPSGSNSLNSNVPITSGNKGICPGLHHISISGNPNGREITRRDQFDDNSLVPSKIPKESINANNIVVDSYKFGEVNGKHTKESAKSHALHLSGMQKSGDASLSWDTRVYKSEKQHEAKGRGDTNGFDWKGSSSRGYPLEGNLRIGEPMSLDSSSSYGGSSSSGSPMASGALKDGRFSSSGNVLISKGSPYSVSSRSMGSVTGHSNMGHVRLSPTSSNGSPSSHSQWGARNSDEIAINRKSTDMVHNGYDKIRGIGTHGTSNSCTDMGNLIRGNHLANGRDNVANKHGNLLTNGNLLVGGINGNVLSYGGGTQMNVIQEEAKLRNAALNYRLMKNFQASLDSEEVKNAGNNFYKAGQFSEALTLYDRAIALCPSNVMYRSSRAAALSGLGRLGEAVKECEEAIRLDCSYAHAHLRIASLYIRLGLMESAKQHLHAAGEQTDFIEVQRLQHIERHFSRCIKARKLQDWHNVIRESDAAVVAGADSAPQIFGFKAEALLRLHKLEHADSVCSMAQKIESSLINQGISSQDLLLQLTRAQVNMALGRFEEAVGAAESAVRIDPSNADAIALLRKARAVAKARDTGNDLFKEGRLFEALALYTEGLESDPTNAVLLCNRAACRLKLSQWEKAVEDCDAALSVQPHYTKALLRRASCLTKLERWEDALQDYEVLRRELPGDAEVARGFFDVQVAMKKSRGEEIYGMKFGGDVEEVTNDEQFREAVSFPGLSVVQFITRWSDRCRELLPFINDLCRRHPCVNFVKVDVEDLPYLAKIESINFIPTFKIYKNGKKLKEITGPSEQSLEYAVRHYSL